MTNFQFFGYLTETVNSIFSFFLERDLNDFSSKCVTKAHYTIKLFIFFTLTSLMEILIRR